MFGKLWKRNQPPSSPAAPAYAGHRAPGSQGNTPAAKRQGAGVSANPASKSAAHHAAPPQADAGLIAADSLGPTLVATIIAHDLTGETAAELGLQLRTVIQKHPGTRNLVLDLQNVDYLDSSCLNMLITLLKAIQEAGGRIAIASAKHRIEVLFKLTRLDRVFPVQRDVLGAIACVERARAA